MEEQGGKSRPNWIFRAMVALSLGVHLIIFMHIARLYHSGERTVIEVSVKDEKPVQRSIPQPRVRRRIPETADVNKISVPKQHVPKMKVEPADTDCPETITEEIASPDVSGVSADAADWQPLAAGSGKYLTRNEYFDMLRLKIESSKEYPESAQRRQIQGRVVVGFTVRPDGRVGSAEVIQSSRHSDLDRAALRAVRNSSPFPRPPSSLFEGPLEMRITIVFELT